jgi:cysteine-rich repeat protein
MLAAALLVSGAGAAHAACGDGVRDPGEQCDPGRDVAGDCCTAACALAPPTTPCRPAAGECDVPEHCTGEDSACPGDVHVIGGTLCADDGSPCSIDACNGAGACIHFPWFEGLACRPATGPCDTTEQCTGVSAPCPADTGRPDGQSCGAVPGTCQERVCRTPARITRVRIIGDREAGDDPDGSVFVRGHFTVHPPPDAFDAAAGIAVRVSDAGALDHTASWPPEECVTFVRGGIRCKVDRGPRRLKGRFNPTGSPGEWNLTLRLKRLDIRVPFREPVTVVVTHHSGIDQHGSIDGCTSTGGSGTLNCRQSP